MPTNQIQKDIWGRLSQIKVSKFGNIQGYYRITVEKTFLSELNLRELDVLVYMLVNIYDTIVCKRVQVPEQSPQRETGHTWHIIIA